MTKPARPWRWYDELQWAAIISPAALLGCYTLTSLAINSGSLLQYFAAFILLGVAVNRLAHIALILVKKRSRG